MHANAVMQKYNARRPVPVLQPRHELLADVDWESEDPALLLSPRPLLDHLLQCRPCFLVHFLVWAFVCVDCAS